MTQRRIDLELDLVEAPTRESRVTASIHRRGADGRKSSPRMVKLYQHEEARSQATRLLKKASEKQLRRLLTSEEPIDQAHLQVDQQRRFVSAKGLSFDGTVALNGFVLDSGLDLQNNLLPALGQEQSRLQQLVRRKVITD